MVAVVVNVQCKCTRPIVQVSPFQLEGNMAPSSNKLAPAPWRSTNHVAAKAKSKACRNERTLASLGPQALHVISAFGFSLSTVRGCSQLRVSA